MSITDKVQRVEQVRAEGGLNRALERMALPKATGYSRQQHPVGD